MDLLFDNCILAVLIAGGYGLDTAELFLPSDGTSCTLPPLPGRVYDSRYLHTADHNLLCGGQYTEDSCIQWSPNTGTWEERLTLDVGRMGHVSWTTERGTYLIGGDRTGFSTTLITSDGTQEPGFGLKYDTA